MIWSDLPHSEYASVNRSIDDHGNAHSIKSHWQIYDRVSDLNIGTGRMIWPDESD